MKKLSLFLMFAAMSVFSFGADVLNKEVSGVSGTSYAEWTATGESGAEYAGQSAGGNDAIQLRSNNNNSGVVVTKTATSGDKVSQIVVKFNSNTADARVLAIYGKDDAYAAVTDLYDSEKQGALVAEVAMSDGAEQTITLSTQYAFIGFRSKSGALYLDEVQINWGEAAPVTPIEVESIALSKSSLELVEGKSSEKLTVTYTPSNANTGKAITWSSSDEDVATVADGVVTAVAAGKAVITATTEKGKEATCSVVVTEKPAPSGDGDIINRDFTGVEGTSYADWTGTGASGAEYAGQSAGGNESVQLRSNNNNSGVVVTKSAGKVSQITVKFNSNTADARVLAIYGKDDAYAAVTDLYDSEKQGALVAEVAMSDGAEQTITLSTQYAFIGFRSKSGALYLDEVVVNWGEVGPVTPVEVESIVLSKTSLELVEGKSSEKLTVTYTPANANTGKAITWSSSDEDVATVADGVVTAVAAGKAVITATTEKGKEATCSVVVTEKPAPSGDGDIINREFTGVEGTSYAEWTATGVSGAEYAGQSAGGNESVQLRSNNNNSGVVVTKSAGKVSQITVKFNSNTASERVLAIYGKDDAYAAPTDLYDSEKQGTLIAEVALADGAEQTINPTTQYAFIGFRSKSGALYLDEVVVNWGEVGPVTPVEVESIALSKTSLELVEGKTSEKLTVTYTPTNANTGKAITWSSSNENVATVADGVVTALAVGTATITATTENGKKATCEVTVKEKPAPSGDGDIINREFTGVEGTSYAEWTATGVSGAEYAGQSAGGNESVQLRSNNNNSGVVVTKSPGEVSQITVKFNSNTASERVLAIYGKDDAYAAPTDLYDSEKQGTLIAEVALADGAEQTINLATQYAFIGFRSKSGALYLDEVVVNWGEVGPVTPVEVESIELSKSSLELVEGKSSEKLTVIYTPTNANTGKAITWSSSDETVATVADGVVTAVAVGKAVITATTENGKEATCSVVVVEKSTPSGDGDILNREFTGVEGNTYTDWTGTGASGAEYAGQSAGGNDAIQLRSNNNNAGIVVTKSAGKVNQIVVKFNENTADARVLAIYGKNAATCYADATELYDAEKQGTLIAEVAYADGAEQTIDVAKVGEFTSVGLRSKSGALYLDEVRIIWSSTPTAVEEIEKTDLDLNAPMYNIVGQRVDASYNGIIIQKGRKFLIVR